MALTTLTNMVIPVNFDAYVAEMATDKNAFFASGILVANPQLAKLLSMGGKSLIMPFTKALSGDSEIPSETEDMGLGGITTSEDIARRQLRVKAFGENALASLLSGDNVMDRIANAYAAYWSAEYTKILLSTCKGVFASMTDHVNDISALTDSASLFTSSGAIDTKFILGDSADKLNAVSVNSAVYAYLLKQDQIDTIPASDGNGTITVYTPLNARVIMDDAVPYDNSTKIGSMYMFGAGAMGFVESNEGIVSSEVYRAPLKGLGENALINRKQFVLHPLGIQWNEPTANPISPTNTQLAAAANWTKKKDKKNVALAEFKFKIV